jgi:DUF1365 family protein
MTGLPTSLSANGPPPDAAAALYVGDVMHARLKPLAHRFVYRVANLLIDLDALPAADRASRLFSVGRFNLYAFRESDHGPRDGSPLRPHVDRLLADAGLPRPARVLLLCYPRVLGFVFNPISVYFAYAADGALLALVYEVRNTFGESHTYVVPVEPGQISPAGVRQTRAKRFFVSPFMPMDQRYHFRILPPGEAVRLRILETDADGPTLAATFVGERRPFAAATLLRTFLSMPFHTAKVVAGIHWEAAKLWLRGAPYFVRGAPPEAWSVEDAPRPGAMPAEVLR